MDQVYTRLYGRNRGGSASPARAGSAPTQAPSQRATSVPSAAVADHAGPSPATSAPSTSPRQHGACEPPDWEARRQTAVALRQKARRSPDGVQLVVRTSLNVTQSVYASSPPSVALTTRLVRQCLDDFRRGILLGRDWNHHGMAVRRTVQDGEESEAAEAPSMRAPRRPPSGFDEEASVMLIKLLRWQGRVNATQRQTDTGTSTTTTTSETGMGNHEKVDTHAREPVEAQLLAWLEAQAAHDSSEQESERASTGRPPVCDASSLLLAQQLRYKPMLGDLSTLAEHVMVPLDVVRDQHRWLFVNEDVALTLHDRLHHHRVVCHEQPAAAAAAFRPAALSARDVRALWVELWQTLGAAWRQRDRLLGSYGRLHGSRARTPVLVPPDDSPCPLPPSGCASPLAKERYDKHVKRAHHAAAAGGETAPLYASDDDTCAFGPLTPARVGISANRHYVIRDALAAVVRSLHVDVRAPDTCVHGSVENPPLSPRAVEGEALLSRGSQVSSLQGSPRGSRVASVLFDTFWETSERSLNEGQLHGPRLSAMPAALHVTGGAFAAPAPRRQTSSLFDVSQDDAAALAAPYLSPECFVHVQRCKQRHAQHVLHGEAQTCGCALSAASSAGALSTVHCFSDDAWSVAVLAVEASLATFDVTQSHVSTTASSASRTGSVFHDIATALLTRTGVSCDAASNFLYATLHEFAGIVLDPHHDDDGHSHACPSPRSPLSPGRVARDATPMPAFTEANAECTPSPRRLAQEWLACVREAYGSDFVEATLVEVCRSGLQWRRAARWAAFVDAHARGGGGGSSTSMPGAGEAEVQTPLSAVPRTLFMSPRAAQRAERALDVLQVPLLGLFPGTVASAMVAPASGHRTGSTHQEAGDAQGLVMGRPWLTAPLLSSVESRLQQWRSSVEARASFSRSHGGDEGEGATFSAWVRVSRRALLLECLAEMPADEAEATAQTAAHVRAGQVRYWVTAHPFIRHLTAARQLNALRTIAFSPVFAARAGMAPESGDGDVLPHAATLFIPLSTLDVLLREEIGVGGAPPEGTTMTATRSPSVGMPEAGSSTRSLRPLAPLETYLGDHWRTSLARLANNAQCGGPAASPHSDLVGQARRAAQAQQQSASYYHIIAQAHAGKATAPRAVTALSTVRDAVEEALPPLSLSLSRQIACVATLRSLLLEWSMTPSSSPTTTARQLRQYLMAQHAECGWETAVVSSDGRVPVPDTLRATCWAVLLGVPSAKYREKLLQASRQSHTALSDRQIALDVPRCHQYHPLLSSREGRDKLFRAIKGWLSLTASDATEERRVYWQGVDSVCAVLLTVAYTDEPLVVFLLDQLLRRFVPYQTDDDGVPREGGGARPRTTTATTLPSSALVPPHAVSASPPIRANSMSDQLGQLEVLLAYVDPLLATHLFGELACRPGLFAISWFLTLFAHNLPIGQVYPVWDFVLLYMEDYPHCFVCLCCAVLLAHREVLLSQDLSACLATLSRLVAHTMPPARLGDAAVLMQVVPPSLHFSPHRPVAPPHAPTTTQHAIARVATLPVQALLERLPPRTTGSPQAGVEAPCGFPWHIDWRETGLFVVDLRASTFTKVDANGIRYRESIVGALVVPLAPPLPGLEAALYEMGGGGDDTEEWERIGGVDDGHPHPSADDARVALTHHIAEQRRHASLDFERRVAEAAAEVARQVQVNGAVMAAAAPQMSMHRDLRGFTPMIVKNLQTPHVVLVGDVSATQANPVETTGWDVAAPLAQRLAAYGVHKVSVLLGGFEALKREVPKLVVPVPEGVNSQV